MTCVMQEMCHLCFFFLPHRGNRAQISLETLRTPHIFINSAWLLDISPLRCSQHLNCVLLHPAINSKSILVPRTSFSFTLTWPKHWRLPYACGPLHFFFAQRLGLWGFPTILVTSPLEMVQQRSKPIHRDVNQCYKLQLFMGLCMCVKEM